jgi:hypothetical protein
MLRSSESATRIGKDLVVGTRWRVRTKGLCQPFRVKSPGIDVLFRVRGQKQEEVTWNSTISLMRNARPLLAQGILSMLLLGVAFAQESGIWRRILGKNFLDVVYSLLGGGSASNGSNSAAPTEVLSAVDSQKSAPALTNSQSTGEHGSIRWLPSLQ